MLGNYETNLEDAESGKNKSKKNLENFASIIPLTGSGAPPQNKPNGIEDMLSSVLQNLPALAQPTDNNSEQSNALFGEGLSKVLGQNGLGGGFGDFLENMGGAEGLQQMGQKLTENMGDILNMETLGNLGNISDRDGHINNLPEKVERRLYEMLSVPRTSKFQINTEIPNIMNKMIEGAGSSDSLILFSKFLTDFVAKNNSSKQVDAIWRDFTNTHIAQDDNTLMPVYLDSVLALGNGISLRTPYGMIDFTVGTNDEISMRVNSAQASMSNAAFSPQCHEMFEPGKLLPVQHLVFKEGQLVKRIKEICDEFRKHEGDMITEGKEMAIEKVLSLQTISQNDLNTHKKDNILKEIFYYLNGKEEKRKVENFFRSLFKSDKWSKDPKTQDLTMNINVFLDLVKEKDLEIYNALVKIKNVKVLKNVNLKDLKLKLRVLDPATKNRMEIYKIDSIISLQPPTASNANSNFDMVYNIFEEDNFQYNYISSVKKPQTAVCGAYLNRADKTNFDLQTSNTEFESKTRKSIETIIEHMNPFKYYLERIYRNTLKGIIEQANKDIKICIANIKKTYADHPKISVIEKLSKYIQNYISTGISGMQLAENLLLYSELSDPSFASVCEDPVVVDLFAYLVTYYSCAKVEIPQLDDLKVGIDEIQFVDNEIACINGRLLGINFNSANNSMRNQDQIESLITGFLNSKTNPYSFTGKFSIHFDKQGVEGDKKEHINDTYVKINDKKSFALKIHDYEPFKMQTSNNTKVFGLMQSNNQNFPELIEKEASNFKVLNQKIMEDYQTGIKKIRLNKLRIQDLDEDGNMIIIPKDDGDTFNEFKATNFAINSLKFKTNENDGKYNVDEVNLIGLNKLEPTSSNVFCKMALNEAKEGKINYFTV